MENRLTFEGNFCDIAMCRETPCPSAETGCTQKQVWEKLKAWEDAQEQGRLMIRGTPFGRTGMPVEKVTHTGEVVARYPSAKAAARANYMTVQQILNRCRGLVKKPFAADGFTYQFAEAAMKERSP